MRIRRLTVIICDEFFVEFTLYTLVKKNIIPPDYQMFFPSIKLDNKLHVVLAMTATMEYYYVLSQQAEIVRIVRSYPRQYISFTPETLQLLILILWQPYIAYITL